MVGRRIEHRFKPGRHPVNVFRMNPELIQQIEPTHQGKLRGVKTQESQGQVERRPQMIDVELCRSATDRL